MQLQPKQWQKVIQKLVASKAGSWFFSLTLHHLDKFIMWLSNKRHSLTSILAGLPVVVLTATGAKSGEPRSVPLLGFGDGDDVILIASSWGRKHHPAWYHNLIVNPEALLTYQDQTMTYVASEATEDERERYWRLAVNNYAGYAAYKVRAGDRKIPVIVLSPKPG